MQSQDNIPYPIARMNLRHADKINANAAERHIIDGNNAILTTPRSIGSIESSLATVMSTIKISIRFRDIFGIELGLIIERESDESI